MRIGQTIIFTEELDLFPHSIIKVGETGSITEVYGEDDKLQISVLLDQTHDGLDYWENIVTMTTNTESDYPQITYYCSPITNK